MSQASVSPHAPHYDLIVIGSGPAGQGAAIQAAELGKRVGMVERESDLGGLWTNAGALPPKTLRAAIVGDPATGQGTSRRTYRGDEVTLEDLVWRVDQVVERERQAIHDRLRRQRVEILAGTAVFVDPRTLSLRSGAATTPVTAERFVIAVGTTPLRPPHVEFDGRTVLDSSEILHSRQIPRALTVIGAGAVGMEYASMFASLGTRVTVVDRRSHVLDAVDREIAQALEYHLRGLGIAFALGVDACAAARSDDGGAITLLAGGDTLPSDVVLCAAGRVGATRDLNLSAVGVCVDANGFVAVDEFQRTRYPQILAAGDVIGPSGSASACAQQGRRAALVAFGHDAGTAIRRIPQSISTIPEISSLGPAEEALAADAMPYVCGRAHYRDLVRGAMTGDRVGLMKLLVHAHTGQVLGVHILGAAASELIQIGQTVMAAGMPLNALMDADFDRSTYADAYRIAAGDATRHLAELNADRTLAA